MKWLILFSGVLANAFASILVKIAMTPPRKIPNISDPFSLLTNWPLILAVILYILSLFFYASALTRFPLNIAHPVLTTGAVALVAVFSIVLFKETFHWTIGLGIFFVVLGVILITSKA